jgi:hypothetical protein
VKATAEELANKMKPSRRFKRRDVALSPYIAKQNALDFQERSINRNKKKQIETKLQKTKSIILHRERLL